MPIICFSGWKGSGKDALAGYFVEKFGAVRVALADPLKDSVASEFKIDRTSLDDPKRKESPLLDMTVNPKDGFSRMIAKFMAKEFADANGNKPDKGEIQENEFVAYFHDRNGFYDERQVYWTPRALAILKGSVNRSVTSNYWTQKTFDKAESYLKEDPSKLIVVTDVRYKSELAQFKERFGDQVTFVRVNRFKESPSSDPSERDLDDGKFDHYVDNTGTLERLYEQGSKLLIKIGQNAALNELAVETENLGLKFS